MKAPRFLLVICLLLTISVYFKSNIMLSLDSKLVSGERLRSFVSAAIFSRADELMHKGAIDEHNQHFKPGSYVGNTDIIPMLKLVTAISPEELAPYQLLARSLAHAQGEISEGTQVLQAGIMQNKNQAGIHELYASIAFLKLFMQDSPSISDKYSALQYLEKAIQLLQTNKDALASDPAFTLENYKILMARLWVDLNKPDLALALLQDSGIDLAGSKDLIFAYLAEYKNTGLPSDEFLKKQNIAKKQMEALNHEQEHSDSCACDECKEEKAKNKPPLKYFFAILRATILFMLLLVSEKKLFKTLS